MDSSVMDAISTFINGENNDSSSDVIQMISTDDSKFLEFIECLREHLTNTDNEIRGKATKLIGDVLSVLSPTSLSIDKAGVVGEFLVSKLSDHHSVQPQALQSLSIFTKKCNPLTEDIAEKICRTIFREIQNQTLVQEDRYATYSIFRNLLYSSCKELQSMGGDFVIGFIQQMDSEKDPRNLMIAFDCVRFISTKFNLAPFTEEMFEVIGCYFPIDFTPPPNNQHEITKDDLIVALRHCFSSCQEFAPFCIPLLLEKMSSNVQSSRIDAFLTLADCAPVYGRSHLSEFVSSILQICKREILMNLSSSLAEASKSAMISVLSEISKQSTEHSANDDNLTSSIVELYQDMSVTLESDDVGKSCLAFSLCVTIGKSSAQALSTITTFTLPILFKKIHAQKDMPTRQMYTKELAGFIYNLKQFSNDEGVVKSFSPHLDSLIDLLVSLLDTSPPIPQAQVIELITVLLVDQNLPTVSYQETFMNTLVQKLRSSADDKTRVQLLASIRELCKANSELSTKCQENLKYFITEKAGTHISETFEALANCVCSASSFKDISTFMINNLSNKDDNALSAVKGLLVLQTLCAADSSCMVDVIEVLLIPIIREVILLHDKCTSKEYSKQVLLCIQKIIKSITTKIDKEKSTYVWSKLEAFVLGTDLEGFLLSDKESRIKILEINSPWQQTRLVSLLEGFINGVNLQACVKNRELVLEKVFMLALESSDEFTQDSACRCTSLLLNKAPVGSDIHWLLDPMQQKLKEALLDTKSWRQLNATRLLSWMTKGLEMRRHSASAIFSSQLFDLLSDENAGGEAAIGLGRVVEDMPGLYTQVVKSFVNPLYKQRFFSMYHKYFLKAYKEIENPAIKLNYLTAISLIATNLPDQVLKSNMDKILPLIFQYIDMASSETSKETLTRTLSILSSTVKSNPELIEPDLDRLVPRLLTLSQDHPHMFVRIESLKCLESATSLTSHSIVPYQEQVVKQLAGPLDDRKRLVRKQAVNTRCAWFML